MMKRMSKQEFYEEASRIGGETGSNYRDNLHGHEKLLRMAEANGWFQEDGTILLTDEEDYSYKIRLWLASYGIRQEEKQVLLYGTMKQHYPKTCEAYIAFFQKNPGNRLPDRLIVLDFVFSEINKEIMLYTEEELQPIIVKTKDYLTIKQTKVFIESLYSMEVYGLRLAYRYEPGQRQSVPVSNDAYPVFDYAEMAYYVFNEDAWIKNRTVEAAAGAKKYADTWLFTALHFTCAIRAADMEDLPAPDPWLDPEALRGDILNGCFSDTDARELCSRWLFKINALSRQPDKTARYGVPDLKVMVPTTLCGAFGVILGLAVSWHKAGEPFIRASAGPKALARLFGNRFRQTAGRTRFQSRRANKAFLQGLEAVSGEGKVQGYMLAALARSHKGGIGTLAETTAAYLRDQNFTGYTPEFIAREMFERGIFGFVPVLMLEGYRKKDFRSLGVRKQTELIHVIGIEPVYLESISHAVSDAFVRAEHAVGEIFSHDGDGMLIKAAVQKAASGLAPAKQEEMFCARIAAGLGCNTPDRQSCIGCGCEIYTMAMLHILLGEYTGLLKKKKSADVPEAGRLENLILKGILPVISQLLETIPELYPDVDTTVYLDELERGMSYARQSGTGDNK